MSMAVSLVVSYAVMAGLGAWFPILSPGIRFLLGGALVPLGLFIASYVIGIPLSASAWAISIAAAAGFAIRFGVYRERPDWPALAVHPVAVLALVAAIIVGLNGHGEYLIYSWDEFSNWLYWTQEAWLVDSISQPEMSWHAMGYVQGLSLALVFPQMFFAHFEPARSLVMPLLWHLALMATIYDVANGILKRSFGIAPFTARMAAWLLVLGALSVEATWTLLPQLILSEKPQIYFLAGITGLVILALFDDEEGASFALALGIGVLAAVSYLIKVAFLTFVPSLVLFAAALIWIRPTGPGFRSGIANRRNLARLAAILGPLFVVYVGWHVFLPFERQAGCLTDLRALLGIVRTATGASETVFPELLLRLSAYISSFKPWLSAVAVLGFAAALFDRRSAVIAGGFVLYAGAYIASLFLLYAACFTGYEAETFASLQRYSRVPIRLIHLSGLVLALIVSAKFLSQKYGGAFFGWIETRPVRVAALGVLAVLFSHQVVAFKGAMRNAFERGREPPVTVDLVSRVRSEAMALRAMIGQKGPRRPRVGIIAQGSDGFEFVQARYWSLANDRRGRVTLYRIVPPYSWGPKKTNLWMAETDQQLLKAHLGSLDIIWPIRTDAWINAVISQLTRDSACASNPTRYFLVATGQPGHTMRCIKKVEFGAAVAPAHDHRSISAGLYHQSIARTFQHQNSRVLRVAFDFLP